MKLLQKMMLAVLAMTVGEEVAAQRIDFNNGQNRTEEGYTAWVVGLESGSVSKAIDGITLTLARGEGSIGTHLMGEWWKDGVSKFSKLTSDGITVSGKAGDEKYTLREGAVSIQLTISGLPAGNHSLLAYHNNPSGYQGPKLDVYVDGTRLLQGIEQTNRAQTPSQSGQSYIRFTAVEGQDVVVEYRTTPDPLVDYTQGYNTTSLYIDALVFDRPNPKTTAADPTPESGDWHAACTEGSSRLSWTAADVAVRHHVFIGTSPDNLSEVAAVTTATHTVSGLDPMKTYYWRIDEEAADGTRYEGDLWNFRPRRLAFPGAEGYGRWAIGGRGGSVYHVTSLDDDADNPQPGTFRYGITKVSGPRTIVFDVAGVINLKARLTCSDHYVTIAGQTAPGRGIMFTGAPFGMGSDGITRFIRMRVGGGDDWDGKSPNPRTSDGLGMAGNDHSIMDHCSVSWTIDEAFSSRNAKNVTLQRTLISEALNRAGHKNYVESKGPDCEHGYAATIGGDCGSYHHNLLAHCEGRNWSLSGGLDGSGSYAGAHDVFNNVVYNWGSRATDGGTHHGQFVANYYKMGPSTTKTILLQADLEGTGAGTQEYYVQGNIRENLDGSQTQDAENVTYNYKLSGGQKLDWTVFVSQPYFESQAHVETAGAAYKSVLSDVGCNQPELDNHDQRMIQETLSGTTSTTGSRSKKKGLIDKESDAEGFSGLNIIEAARPAHWDSDQDGMPDWWETCMGLDPQTDDHHADFNQDGYTNLEDYLNQMADPHFVSADEHFSIPMKPYFQGFLNPTFTLSPEMDNGTSWHADANGVLNVWVGLPLYCSVDVTASEGNHLTTRTFWFYRSDNSAVNGIPRVVSLTRTNAVYNLQGQRMAAGQPTHRGIYIAGGRKVVR